MPVTFPADWFYLVISRAIGSICRTTRKDYLGIFLPDRTSSHPEVKPFPFIRKLLPFIFSPSKQELTMSLSSKLRLFCHSSMNPLKSEGLYGMSSSARALLLRRELIPRSWHIASTYCEIKSVRYRQARSSIQQHRDPQPQMLDAACNARIYSPRGSHI